ncbi:TonB-dependent receptor [bacterium]|nr:TonB-dependent receptor [bacterium]
MNGRIEDHDTDAGTGRVDRHIDNQYQSLAWVHEADSGMHTRAQVYHNRLTIQEDANFGLVSTAFGLSPAAVALAFPGQTDEAIIINEKNYSERYDAEFEQSFPLFDTSQWVWGFGARLDRVRSPAFLDRQDTIDTEDFRLFANLEHKVEKLTVNAGFLLSHNDLVQESLSRRLGLSYAFSQQHHLRAAATTAYRTPSLLEENQMLVLRFSDGEKISDLLISEGDLKSAKVEEYDIAYKGFWYGGAMDVELRKFKRRLDNLVDSRRDSISTVRIRNDDNQLQQNGVDFIVNANFAEFGRVSVNYARTHFDYEKLRDDTGVRDSIREGYPEYQYGAQWSKRWVDWFESSATYRYMPETNWLGGDRIERFARFDLRLAWLLKHADNDYTVELIGQNLGDDYAVFDTQNVFEPRVFLRLSASLY